MIGKVATRDELIRTYEEVVRGIDEEAANNKQRAYGGVVRAKKGSLLEDFTPHHCAPCVERLRRKCCKTHYW